MELNRSNISMEYMVENKTSFSKKNFSILSIISYIQMELQFGLWGFIRLDPLKIKYIKSRLSTVRSMMQCLKEHQLQRGNISNSFRCRSLTCTPWMVGEPLFHFFTPWSHLSKKLRYSLVNVWCLYITGALRGYTGPVTRQLHHSICVH